MTQLNAEPIAAASTASLTDSANSASTALQELGKAYQELATKNAGNLKSAIQELSGLKNPSEFMEVQQRLIKDGVQAAVVDSQKIGHLTAAAFTAAFEPVKKQIEAMHATKRH